MVHTQNDAQGATLGLLLPFAAPAAAAAPLAADCTTVAAPFLTLSIMLAGDFH
jgi:hypothetical protein